MNENRFDYVAKLNIEGNRKVFDGNKPKIDSIYNKFRGLIKKDSEICEIGLGNGYFIRKLSTLSNKVTGIDISGYMINKLNEIFQKEGVNAYLIEHDISDSVEKINKRFDIIFCLDILEHIKELSKATENIKKLLEPEGLLIATLPWKENIENNMVVCPECDHKFHKVGHLNFYNSVDEIQNTLGEDLKIIKYGFSPTTKLTTNMKMFLKRTIFRKNYYKKGKPDFQTNIYFVAKMVK